MKRQQFTTSRIVTVVPPRDGMPSTIFARSSREADRSRRFEKHSRAAENRDLRSWNSGLTMSLAKPLIACWIITVVGADAFRQPNQNAALEKKLAELKAAIKDPKPERRQTAYDEIRKLGKKALPIAGALIEAAAKEDISPTGTRARSAIKSMDMAIVPDFLRGLKDKSDITRMFCVEMLEERIWQAQDMPGVIPALVAALDDGHPEVVASALRCLAKEGIVATRALDRLIQFVKEPDGPTNRARRSDAAKAIGNMGPAGRRAAEALLGLYSASDTSIRAGSILAAARVAPDVKKVHDATAKATKDEDAGVRRCAYRALGRLRGVDKGQVEQMVKRARKDKDIPVRVRAAQAWSRLGFGSKTPLDIYSELLSPATYQRYKDDVSYTFARGLLTDVIVEHDRRWGPQNRERCVALLKRIRSGQLPFDGQAGRALQGIEQLATAPEGARFYPAMSNRKNRHVVFVVGDAVYRSEESMPTMAKLLARRHGFRCTVVFSQKPPKFDANSQKAPPVIDPQVRNHFGGLDHGENADLLVLFLSFRNPGKRTCEMIKSHLAHGKPVIAFRGSTYAFNFNDKKHAYAHWDWRNKDAKFVGGFGRQILGDTWAGTIGRPGGESTQGFPAKGAEKHPLWKGIDSLWAPSHLLATSKTLHGDAKPVAMGKALGGLNSTSKPVPGRRVVPLVWTKTYQKARIVTTTLGEPGDFAQESVRRLVVNAVYWSLELPVPDQADVRFTERYKPSPVGLGKHRQGVQPIQLTK